MSKIPKILLALVLMTAVLAYTVYHFILGRTDQFAFLVYVVILGIPYVNMINILIQELRNR